MSTFKRKVVPPVLGLVAGTNPELLSPNKLFQIVHKRKNLTSLKERWILLPSPEKLLTTLQFQKEGSTEIRKKEKGQRVLKEVV